MISRSCTKLQDQLLRDLAINERYIFRWRSPIAKNSAVVGSPSWCLVVISEALVAQLFCNSSPSLNANRVSVDRFVSDRRLQHHLIRSRLWKRTLIDPTAQSKWTETKRPLCSVSSSLPTPTGVQRFLPVQRSSRSLSVCLHSVPLLSSLVCSSLSSRLRIRNFSLCTVCSKAENNSLVLF